MGSIRKHGQKYQARVSASGEYHTKSFPTIEAAEAWVQQLEGKKVSSEPQVSKTTFAEILTGYMSIFTTIKRGADNERIIIRRLLSESWTQKPVTELSLADLVAFRDKRLQTIKPSTFKREWAIVKHCANKAWGMGFKEVDDAIFTCLPIPTVIPRKVDRITQEQIDKLLTVLETPWFRNKYMHPLIRLAVDTGMRRGELVGITWADVNMTDRVINVPASITKTGQPRTVVFSDLGHGALLDFIALAKLGRPQDKVVGVSGNAVRCAWEHVRDAAKLPHLHFHDLRHEGISRMHEEGMTKTEVMDQSGHSESRTLDRYSHASLERIKSIRGGKADD